MNTNSQQFHKINIRLNLFVVLTLVVFLTPFAMQITRNNYVKLVEDAAYMMMLLYSVQMMLEQGCVKVKVSKTGLFLVLLITIFALKGIYYNGLSLVMLQFREFKYLLVPLILIPYRDINYFNSVWTTLKIIAAISIPVSIVQWFVYGTEGDRITGVLGYGASGTLTLFLMFLFFTELGLRLYNDRPVLGFYFSYLIPTIINETKITFILLPIMLFITLLVTRKLKSIKAIGIILVVAILLLGWAILYEKNYENSIFDYFSSEQLDAYLYSTDWEEDAGRFAKVAYGFEIVKENNLLFGYGLGASYYGETSGLKGYAFKNFYIKNIFGGTKPQLFLSIIDLGLGGIILIVLILSVTFIRLLKKKEYNLWNMAAINSMLLVFITLIYQNIFYTYQIMYIFVLYTSIHFKMNHGVKEDALNDKICHMYTGPQEASIVKETR